MGGRLRSMVRCETFFGVGDLNHTFALKPAHTRKRVGNHPRFPAAQADIRKSSDFPLEAFVHIPALLFTGKVRGERFTNACHFESVFTQVRPQTNALRTVRTLQRTVRTLTWNVSHCWGQTTTAAVGPAARNPYGFDLSYTTAAVFRGQRGSSPYLIPPDQPLIHRWIEAIFLEFDGGAIRGGVVPRY